MKFVFSPLWLTGLKEPAHQLANHVEDFFSFMPTFNCCFNRHTQGLHYTRRMLVLNAVTVVTICLFFNDWCECMGECAQHHDIFPVYLSLGNKVVL